ncbi:hypothetical protein L0244_13755 [bacterium]|nr:hypothetical protein [bacterium]
MKKKFAHATSVVTWKESQTTKTLYIPDELVKEVSQWLREYKRVKSKIEDLSNNQRKIFRELQKIRQKQSIDF